MGAASGTRCRKCPIGCGRWRAATGNRPACALSAHPSRSHTKWSWAQTYRKVGTDGLLPLDCPSQWHTTIHIEPNPCYRREFGSRARRHTVVTASRIRVFSGTPLTFGRNGRRLVCPIQSHRPLPGSPLFLEPSLDIGHGPERLES